MNRLIFLITIIMLFSFCSKRTPEKILSTVFDIDIKKFDYTIDAFNEYWYDNGDGHCYIKLKINKLTDDNINYLISKGAKKLPISESDLFLSHKIQNEYSKINHKGYYLYSQDNIDPRNFQVFIIDVENDEAVLYYQIM